MSQLILSEHDRDVLLYELSGMREGEEYEPTYRLNGDVERLREKIEDALAERVAVVIPPRRLPPPAEP